MHSTSSEAHSSVKNVWENEFLSFIQKREASYKVKRTGAVREKFIISKEPKSKTKVKVVSEAQTVQNLISHKLQSQNVLSVKSTGDQISIPISPALELSNSELSITEPMTFYPTMEELANFDDYVAFMESQGAHKAGIARIVPPKEWIARKAGYEPSEIDIVINSPVKQNITKTPVRGAFTTFADRSIPPFTLPEYLRLATSPKYLTPSHSSYEELEQLYWEQNQDASSPSPIYGADVQTTLTDPDQQVFNLTKLPSLISGMLDQIPGIHQPYVYIGMWKATFSWHVEDMDLYAVNYLHYGASKTWYCVPPQFGYKLEQLAQKLFPDMTNACQNLLRHKVVMIGPELLKINHIPVQKMVHEQGTIMVLFPHAYHSGFNHGFNMAETLNFAIPRWVDYGKRFRGCLCRNQKREVKIDMEQFVEMLQPDKLEEWKKGVDFALHPEDPVFMKKYLDDIEMKAELNYITREEFKNLKEGLSLKREIAPWFRKKFPMGYSDDMNLKVPEDSSGYPLVDENDNIVPVVHIKVEDFIKVPLIDCYVKMKSLEEDAATEYIEERREYDAMVESQRVVTEAQAASVKVGQCGKGGGFVSFSHDDLKARKSQVKCSAKRRHRFKACTKCPGCLHQNCGACVYCLDKPQYGGREVLKQKCAKRICRNPSMVTCGSCKWQI